MRSKVIYVRVPEDVHDAILVGCEQKNVNLTMFVNRAVIKYLEADFGYQRPAEVMLP